MILNNARKSLMLISGIVIMILFAGFGAYGLEAETVSGFAGLTGGDLIPRVSEFGFVAYGQAESASLAMYDAVGNAVAEWSQEAEDGKYEFLVDTSAFEAGEYRLELSVEGDLHTAEIELADAVSMEECEVVLSGCEGLVYDGQEKSASAQVLYKGYVLRDGTDYTLEYANNVNAGMAKAVAVGIGAYEGSAAAEFEILPADISGAEVAEIPVQFYTGDAITPRPAYVKADGRILAESADYGLEYRSHVSTGTAKVIINGIGNYTGSCETEFTITQLVTEIQLPSEFLAIKKGNSKVLEVTVLPVNAVNKNIIWTSTDTTIATVDSEGMVEGLKKGKVTIIAQAADGSGVKAQTMLFVLKNMPKSVHLDRSKVRMKSGGSLTLEATVWPYNADIRKVLWTSSDTTVAQVSSKGKVTAVGAGKAVITATTVNGLTAECKIVVRE